MTSPRIRAALSLLTVCGIEELAGHREAGVTHVLSILDPGTPDPEAFGLFDRHHRTVMRFHDIVEPGPGLIPPERGDVEAIVAFGRELVEDTLAEGSGHLLIHCHLGISRSTASMTTMVACAHPDWSDEKIVERVEEIRPQAWPNLRMVDFADDILGRGGRLSTAVSALHGRQLASKPHLADTFRRLGRSMEVERAGGARAA